MNQTHNIDFLLDGFSDIANYRICLFVMFFIVYCLTLSGNILIILVVRFHPQLHTPMYFFITNLSLLEMWYISTTVPKLIAVLTTNNNRISFQACFAQLYMFHSLGITECILLAIMALDRCMAICNPLRYTTIMSDRICRVLASVCWCCGFMTALIPMTFTVIVTFCGPYHLKHYFCDLAPLLRLACRATPLTDTVNRFVGGFATLFNLGIVIIMYLSIIISIVKIRSNTGRRKAFSTCSAHLLVVTLFYSSSCVVYASPKGGRPADTDKMLALVYAMLTPFLNPIIYSFRNKAVKEALQGGLQRIRGRLEV
ncbi:olfactory receptor 11H4-like [Pelodytes ibericus]